MCLGVQGYRSEWWWCAVCESDIQGFGGIGTGVPGPGSAVDRGRDFVLCGGVTTAKPGLAHRTVIGYLPASLGRIASWCSGGNGGWRAGGGVPICIGDGSCKNPAGSQEQLPLAGPRALWADRSSTPQLAPWERAGSSPENHHSAQPEQLLFGVRASCPAGARDGGTRVGGGWGPGTGWQPGAVWAGLVYTCLAGHCCWCRQHHRNILCSTYIVHCDPSPNGSIDTAKQLLVLHTFNGRDLNSGRTFQFKRPIKDLFRNAKGGEPPYPPLQ